MLLSRRAFALIICYTPQGAICEDPAMNAVALICREESHGDLLNCMRLRKFPIPTPQRGELLVRVHGSSVNPVDYKILKSLRGLPRVLGFDVAGVVVAKGDHCSNRPKIGDWSLGGLGEESQTGLMPTNLNFLQAASLALVSLTSYQAFKKVEGSLLKDDLRVAITSGAGGTGFVAIQLAKAYGAVEIITACSSSHAAFVRSLGATTVVDYTKSSIWDHVTPDSLDVVYDNYGAPGTADKALDKIRKGGSFIFLPGRGGQLSKKRKHGVRQVNFHVTNSAHYRDLDALKVLVEDYKLKPRIQAVFPLQAARSAMQRLKSGHVAGKVVVNITASNISATDQRLVHY